MRRTRACNSDRTARRGLLCLLGDTEAGFSIIEVVVSALMVALIAGATATALISTGKMSGDQRRRSQAYEIAQQDQDRLRAMSTRQLSGLNQTRTVTLDGTAYTVTSTGRFLTSTDATTCTSSGSGSADYLRTVSSVNWATNRRTPVTSESIVTPPSGGTLLTQVRDQNNLPLSGVTVTATGPDQDSASTDSDGCTIFGGLLTGNYTVTVAKLGFVTLNGDPSPVPSPTTTVSPSGTAYPTGNPLALGLAGAISVTNLPAGNPTSTFQAPFSSTLMLKGQLAPALSWYGSGTVGSMAAAQQVSPASPSAAIATPVNLFPFSNGASNYTNNYTVWAGKCVSNMPPTGTNLARASVSPGTTANPTVTEPALNVVVTYAGSRVKPDHVKLTYTGSDSPACTYNYQATVAADATSLTGNGALASPGQPFATNGTPASASGLTGSYSVCADYDPPGSTTARKVSVSSTNSNFTAATTVNIAMTSSSGGGTC